MDTSSGSLAASVGFAEYFAAPLADAVQVALGGLRHLVSSEANAEVVGDIVQRARAAFETPLAEILAGAWEKRAEIQEFCDPGKHPAGESSVVELLTHTVTWTEEPVVEVIFNQHWTVKIRITLKAEFTLASGALVIKDAKIMKLRTGKIVVTASVAVQGVDLPSQAVPIELPGELSFGEGIAIRPMVAVAKIAADVEPVAVA
ncbi:MAG: hypothetical protein ACJ8J0_27540 [Longimicrobiaceae bacterium]